MRARSWGLEWSRVDLDRKVAWLDHGTTKSGDGRGIPLNADAVAALEATRGQHPRWCFTFGGQRIQQSSTAWGKAKQRAGIEDFRFHDLRHYLPSLTMSGGLRQACGQLWIYRLPRMNAPLVTRHSFSFTGC